MQHETPDLEVRLAGPEDMDAVMALALAASDENGFLDADPAKLAMAMWSGLVRDKALCAVIGPKDGEIQGAVLLQIGSMWYASGEILEERAIFVHPDHRSAKGGRAKRLCEFSKRAADTLGMPLIIGVLSHQRTAAKLKLYERQFGAPAGAFWLYGATTGADERPSGA